MAKFAFIGAGRMAGAMVRGLLRSGVCQAADISVLGGAGASAAQLSKDTGVKLAKDAVDLLHGADLVVVACKPQQLASLDKAFGELTKGKAVLSVLAGTRLATLQKLFLGARNIVRAMPNTPGAVGQGITARCALQTLSANDQALIDSTLAGLGMIVDVPEGKFDAVTAVSGSGPGFFFEYVAAYEEAAVALGFTPEQAKLLVRQTFAGSLALLSASGETPEALRNQVTSPGGTTRAGLDALAAHKFREVVAVALIAAKNRSQELGR